MKRMLNQPKTNERDFAKLEKMRVFPEDFSI